MMGIQGSMSDLDPQAQRQLLGMLGVGAQYGVLLPFSRKQNWRRIRSDLPTWPAQGTIPVSQ
jgi:hypothetical protein